VSAYIFFSFQYFHSACNRSLGPIEAAQTWSYEFNGVLGSCFEIRQRYLTSWWRIITNDYSGWHRKYSWAVL